MPDKTVIEFIEKAQEDLTEAARRIWSLAEVGLKETKSAEVLIEMGRRHGFTVEEGVAGMPTAFVATYGSGHPVIGLLGEYDALPGLSQKAAPVKEPSEPGRPGHGCGHNLLGVGALGAAIALKEAIARHRLPGTVKLFGCPAEETLVGKVFMVRDGLFKDVDAAITWHPGSTNSLWAGSALAMNSAKFTFHGRSSHAAGDPQSGRSALDAVELMNIGANYLREHIIQEARLHYVITKGGGEPNIVPPIAEAWYYVRAPKRKQVEEIFERLQRIADGASLMTETTYDIEFLTGCYNTLHNEVIGDLLFERLTEVGAPPFDAADQEFARAMVAGYPAGQMDGTYEWYRERGQNMDGKVLHDGVMPPLDKGKVSSGSTDVGDVSFVTPTAQLTTACEPLGAPGHSWQVTASSGAPLGFKGMLVAAKVMGLAALDLLSKPETLARARQEFRAATKDSPYVSPLPPGLKPPLNQLDH
ncbi:MAG: M20 family metallopeptidase [Bacillota bacterium]